MPAHTHGGLELLSPPTVPAALAGAVADRAPRVLVVGDALVDTWLSGPARRVARDGPVPVVELAETSSAAGGAGNTAANLAALGAAADLVTVLGTDDAALHDMLRDAGVGTVGCVTEPGRATPVKHRLMSAGLPMARYDAGPVRPPRPETGAALAGALTDAVSAGVDAVLVADYGLGGIPAEVCAVLHRLRSQVPLLVVDSRTPGAWADLNPDVMTPNAAEAAALLGELEPDDAGRPGWVVSRRAALVRACGGADVAVTLDVDGAVYLPADSAAPPLRTVADPGPQARACGAGDTFTAACTAALAAGVPSPSAFALAQAAADVAVRHDGTAVCSAGALTARLAAADRGSLLAHRDLLAVVGEHRGAGHRVVFTNGCFDVLHRGHVAYLQEAKALGDLLVVALNSDDSVARLKGPDRPVNPLPDRAGVVGAIGCVDAVTSFDEDTPAALIEKVRPDVYAKGGDYTAQMLPETPVVERLGGEVRVLGYLSDHSTTAIVGRIRAGRR